MTGVIAGYYNGGSHSFNFTTVYFDMLSSDVVVSIQYIDGLNDTGYIIQREQ